MNSVASYVYIMHLFGVLCRLYLARFVFSTIGFTPLINKFSNMCICKVVRYSARFAAVA